MAEVERALNASRPDDADRVLRELETWRALSGRWHTARYEPGGRLSVPVSPGNCIEAIHAALSAAFPERAGLLTAQLARSLWRKGRRVHGSYPFLRNDPPIDDPEQTPSVVVLAPPDVARDELRIALELGSAPATISISPYMVSLIFRLDGESVVAGRGDHRLLVNGEEVSERRLEDGDLITAELSTGGYTGKLLFLDRAR